MTKGEARELYLRYLGEATVNGDAKEDADLKDTFDYLLGAEVLAVGMLFPKVRTTDADKGVWSPPEDCIEVRKMVNDAGMPVAYQRVGNDYAVAEDCVIEYNAEPEKIYPKDPDDTVIDLKDREAQLVPIKAAVDAALGNDSFAYKVSFLTTTYNAMLASLQRKDGPVFRRVFGV